MRIAIWALSLLIMLSACHKSEKNEIYNENNTIVKNGVVYDTDEAPIDGLYRTYHSNGNVKMEVYSKNGKPNGKGRFYNEDGSLLFEGTFEDGAPVGTIYHYYRNGKVHNEQNYAEGVLHGVQQSFSKKGELRVEVVFDKGKALSGYVVVNDEKVMFTPEELEKLE